MSNNKDKLQYHRRSSSTGLPSSASTIPALPRIKQDPNSVKGSVRDRNPMKASVPPHVKPMLMTQQLGLPSGKTQISHHSHNRNHAEEPREERPSGTQTRSGSHRRYVEKTDHTKKRSSSLGTRVGSGSPSQARRLRQDTWAGSGEDHISHRKKHDMLEADKSITKEKVHEKRVNHGPSPGLQRKKAIPCDLNKRSQKNDNINSRIHQSPSTSGWVSPQSPPGANSTTPPIAPTSPPSGVSQSGIPGGGCTQSKTKDMDGTPMNVLYSHHNGQSRDAKNGPQSSFGVPFDNPVNRTLDTSSPPVAGMHSVSTRTPSHINANAPSFNHDSRSYVYQAPIRSSLSTGASSSSGVTRIAYPVLPDPGKSGVGVSKSTSHTSSAGSSGYPQNTAQSSSSHTGHRGATTSFTTSPSHTDVPRGVKGLRNLGNTCFMNCILQCLSHTPKLADIFKSSKLNYCQKSVMKGQLAKAYGNLLKEMWDEGSVSVSPTGFKSQIQKYARRFMGYEQQDCQEFLRFLLSGLHEDLNTPVSFKDKGKAPKSDEELAEYSWRKYLSFESSPISDLFMGQLKSTLVCEKCKQKSVTFDPFWDLSLPMKRLGIGVDAAKVTDCLKEFTTKEKLTGPESAYCDKCDSLEEAEKTLEIQKLPTILVLHLKRFAGLRFRSKLDVPIDIPLQLEMGPYLVNKSGATLFSLYGVTNHSGTAYGGHYTALCKHVHSGQWYSFNDSQVNPHGAPSRPSAQAYVLFYSRKDQN